MDTYPLPSNPSNMGLRAEQRHFSLQTVPNQGGSPPPISHCVMGAHRGSRVRGGGGSVGWVGGGMEGYRGYRSEPGFGEATNAFSKATIAFPKHISAYFS